MLKTISEKLLNNLEFRFLLVGGFNTLFGYLISVGIYEVFEQALNVAVIAAINAIVTITISFYMQRNFVFRSKEPWLKEYVKMYAVNAISMLANIFLIWLAVDIFTFPFWLSQGLITFFLTIYMYFAHKYFTFKKTLS